MEAVIFTDVCHGGFGRYAGTYRIATELRLLGCKVQVVEFFTKFDDNQIKEVVRKYITRDTLFVGFSCTFLLKDSEKKHRIDRFKRASDPDWENTFGREDIFDIFKSIKHRNSNTQIVVGGAKAPLMIKKPWSDYIDFVLTGQSDESIKQLYQHLKNNKPLKYYNTESRAKWIKEQDYPINNFSTSRIKFQSNDLIFPKEHLPMEIARGCIFKCSFCSYPILNKKLWEFNRVPKIIAEDLKEANDKFGSEGFMFADDTYNDSEEKVKALHQEFTKLPFKLSFSTYARADILVAKPWTADLLYESGMRSVFFGIETLNHMSGKIVGKGMDPNKLKEGLYKIKQRPGWNDIITTSGFIIGLPYDTEETIMQTLEWLKQDDCPLDSFSPSPLRLSPTSAMGKDMKKYGYWFDDNGKWHSKWLNEYEAERIVREEWYKVLGKKNRTKFQFTFFNRMQNLGYTLEDFDSGKWTLDDSLIRLNKMKDKYYIKLLNLDFDL